MEKWADVVLVFICVEGPVRKFAPLCTGFIFLMHGGDDLDFLKNRLFCGVMRIVVRRAWMFVVVNLAPAHDVCARSGDVKTACFDAVTWSL
jgi:hypothetical protein